MWYYIHVPARRSLLNTVHYKRGDSLSTSGKQPKYEIRGNKLHMVFDLKPRISQSGKSMLLATTSGREEFVHDGKTLLENLNAYRAIAEWEANSN